MRIPADAVAAPGHDAADLSGILASAPGARAGLHRLGEGPGSRPGRRGGLHQAGPEDGAAGAAPANLRGGAMHRMRLFPICGGEDEPKGDPPEDSQGPTKAEVAELQQQLQQAEGNRKKLEAMLLDPSYVEFIATRTKGGVKEKPEGKAAENEPDFDAMSTKDLVKFLDGRWEQRVSELVKGVREESAHDRSVRVINETAGRHADFWEDPETLEQIAHAHPHLHP